MLVEFSVENHRAFRDKQTFSMVASATTERAGHGHVLETGLSAAPHVLSEACIFGANGSGKSSLIDAMEFMRHVVEHSFHQKPGRGLHTKPFKFHSEWREKPSEFEVVFVHEETLFQYGFALDQERILEEWLFARPKSTQRERQLFTRIFDEEDDNYVWELNAEQLKGKRDSWKDATRKDALFLTTAVHMNAEALQAPYEWISNVWRLLEPDDVRHMSVSAKRLEDENWNRRILGFMEDADIPLSGLYTEQHEMPENIQTFIDSVLKTSEDAQEVDEAPRKMLDVFTRRRDDTGAEISLPMRDESSGTQALFNLAAPILDVLDHGMVLLVDELNTGLHPLAFQHLVSLFAAPETNPKGAQLIFTTHDTSVADQECMGRDQIWIVDKSNDLAAKLVPLSDFKERGAKGFQKKYLDGRFGGVPKVAH